MGPNEEPKDIVPENQNEQGDVASPSSEQFASTPMSEPAPAPTPEPAPASESFAPNFAPSFGASDPLASQPTSTPEGVPTATPTDTMPPVAPVGVPVKKSKKGLIISLIIAAVVLLGLAGAVSVYAFVYNNPQNAVNDALAKSFLAKSGTMTGTISVKSDETSVKADLTVAANEAGQASIDAKTSMKVSDQDVSFDGHMVMTKDSYYAKVDDVRSIINDLYGEEYSSLIDSYYGDLLDKVDSKWIGLSFSDMEELSEGSIKKDELTCTQNVINKLSTDAAIRDEVVNVYSKNPLFTVESKGSDENGNHYKLIPVSNADARKFAAALVETKFFVQLDDCSPEDYKKTFTEDFAAGESSTSDDATLELWVDGWSHGVNKMVLTSSDEDADITIECLFKYNVNPSITVPEAETTVDDIKTEVQKLEESFMMDVDTGVVDIEDSSYYFDYSSNL